MARKNSPDSFQRLTPKQAKEIDRIAVAKLGITGLVLMENAGIRCTEVLSDRFPQARLFVLCGTGNNGGDGLVIARQWAVRGGDVEVWIAGPPEKMSPDCLANWNILNRLSLVNLKIHPPASTLPDPKPAHDGNRIVIVDALLGISASGVPRGSIADSIRWSNQALATRVAIDVPTGLDPESGMVHATAFQADMTITIERPKTFVLNLAASPFFGELVVVSLGIPAWIVAMAIGLSENEEQNQ